MTTFTTEDKQAAWTAYDLTRELLNDPALIPNEVTREIVTQMLIKQADAITELQQLFDKTLSNWAKDMERNRK